MTRYFYFPHSKKELPVFSLIYEIVNVKVWILNPNTHKPIEVKFLDTKENWILFNNKADCENYYK